MMLGEVETTPNGYIYIQDKFITGRCSRTTLKPPKYHGIPRLQERLSLPFTAINGFVFRRSQSYVVTFIERDYTRGNIYITCTRVENACSR